MASNASPLHVAVCGAGAFGRNHLRVYCELERDGTAVKLAAIVESDAVRAAALREEWGVPVYASVDEALAARERKEIRINAASVCVPTSAHHAAAAPLLRAGIDLLIEKPIAASTAEADAGAMAGALMTTCDCEVLNPASETTKV